MTKAEFEKLDIKSRVEVLREKLFGDEGEPPKKKRGRPKRAE